jgi:hypothetical protein
MIVKELIAALRKMPQELEVCTWDHEEDEYIPITGAIFEDGCSDVHLLTEENLPEYVNVCEHGGHPAPLDQRFCSKACEACESAPHKETGECSNLCGFEGLEV